MHNTIFMDVGEQVVKNDKSDGDNANGYGYNGTLSFADTWKTAATVTPTLNAGTWTKGAFNDPKVMYQAQDPNGMLMELVDCIFYHNIFVDPANTATTAYSTLESVAPLMRRRTT